jgi:hypothetical protein
MKIKNIFAILIFSFFINACSVNQNLEKQVFIFKKKTEVRESVTPTLLSELNYILLLLEQNDLDLINSKFINPTFGFYEVFKNEKENKIKFQQKIQIEEISNNIDSFDIKEEEAIFNCSPFDDTYYGWNKEGVFLTANTKPYLSETMKESNLLEPNKYKEDEIKRAIFIEKTSYEVIIPHNMVFYITKINNQWYITLIDNVKTDCSE